jgi:hypothetical protein
MGGLGILPQPPSTNITRIHNSLENIAKRFPDLIFRITTSSDCLRVLGQAIVELVYDALLVVEVAFAFRTLQFGPHRYECTLK